MIMYTLWALQDLAAAVVATCELLSPRSLGFRALRGCSGGVRALAAVTLAGCGLTSTAEAARNYPFCISVASRCLCPSLAFCSGSLLFFSPQHNLELATSPLFSRSASRPCRRTPRRLLSPQPSTCSPTLRRDPDKLLTSQPFRHDRTRSQSW